MSPWELARDAAIPFTEVSNILLWEYLLIPVPLFTAVCGVALPADVSPLPLAMPFGSSGAREKKWDGFLLES